MGMFDYLQCHYPLPIKGANNLKFQTKDTDAQFLDNYEIREDGTLWHEIYDVEDRSDPNADGIMALVGKMTRINSRWERDMMTGEIRFYAHRGEDWLEFSAYFVGGELRQLEIIKSEQ